MMNVQIKKKWNLKLAFSLKMFFDHMEELVRSSMYDQVWILFKILQELIHAG